MDDLGTIGDDIAKEVIKQFETNDLKGKPVIRSNGVKEWTVLAGVVALKNGKVINTISIATGVKALPDATIKSHSNGLLLHDCHAEILAFRAFNWFVIQECLKVSNLDRSDYFEFNDGHFNLKDGIEFGMYVSEPPCGDASLELLIDENDEEWRTHTELAGGVLRGRENYTLKGRVRTKPGRRDSPMTLSKSCSDKLAVKQFTSILNGVTSSFVHPKGCYLKYLVIPEDKVDMPAMERCFHDRFNPHPINHMYTLNRLKILTTKETHSFAKEQSNQPPSNTSLIYVPKYNFNESIVNSVKEGYYTKRKSVRKNGESELSRYKLFQESQSLSGGFKARSYFEWKLTNKEYRKAKEIAKEAIGAWCCTATDDFDILKNDA
ncbi:hypothetical protein WICANDRAFT_97105 [Wickerhamomyces anomalus NRRL Y-366-8]|uniref:A to I editase domain-containing protein n=1 Tax=Wickerhamomyces anomalus (strain ATCC 58044 / CBS 1984 / NCYC 433 / NRRL Y-366-8) TaxID=683960 RepID=A0A1E3NWY8_WICAA|nr:uncharacterized protein WICANDRAFT_97105 [Wickerhamomyces anomalus NRRL Y-366-8]ODQ57699.1 hypothetical protein WICANDRAFT_97105 [Wickerhamomyces anomalus NRRL Y-366-8]